MRRLTFCTLRVDIRRMEAVICFVLFMLFNRLRMSRMVSI